MTEWEEVTECPNCKNPEMLNHMYTSIPSHRRSTKWSLCGNCGHTFVSPRPSREWLRAYYTDGYRKEVEKIEEEDPEKVPASNGREETIRAMNEITILKRWVGRSKTFKRHLDIGSSTGALLAGIMDAFNVGMSSGVEPSDAWRQFSVNSHAKFMARDDQKNRVHELRTYSYVEDVPKIPKYDLITVIHTLEHMFDPLGALTHVRENLALKDALLLVEVPYMWGGRPDPLMWPHMHAFRQDTLRDMITRAGFNVYALESDFSDVAPGLKYGPHSLTAICGVPEIGNDVDSILEIYNNNRENSAYVLQKIAQRQPKYEMG